MGIRDYVVHGTKILTPTLPWNSIYVRLLEETTSRLCTYADMERSRLKPYASFDCSIVLSGSKTRSTRQKIPGIKCLVSAYPSSLELLTAQFCLLRREKFMSLWATDWLLPWASVYPIFLQGPMAVDSNFYLFMIDCYFSVKRSLAHSHKVCVIYRQWLLGIRAASGGLLAPCCHGTFPFFP